MRYAPLDSETVPFGPGNGAPKLVCLQYDAGSGARIVTRKAGALTHAKRLLDDDIVLEGHSIVYDLAVFAAEGLAVEVFEKLKRGQVYCTWVAERAGEISGATTRKKLDLATCMKA